jgi:hypothetical protein
MHATAEDQELATAAVPATVLPGPIGAPAVVARTVS